MGFHLCEELLSRTGEPIMEKNQIVRIKYCDYVDLCSECVRFSVSGMKIISGTAHRELAERIAQSVGIQLTDVTVNTFPDGESFVKINENIRGKDVFLIQPTCPRVSWRLR